MRSLTRSSLPTRCAGKSPDAILRRTVFSETPSLLATSATLRNRSPGSGGAHSFPARASCACSSFERSSRGRSLTARASRASLKRLKASRAACRAIVRMRRVRSSSPLALAAGRFPPTGRRLVMSGRYSPRVWRRQRSPTYALARKGPSFQAGRSTRSWRCAPKGAGRTRCDRREEERRPLESRQVKVDRSEGVLPNSGKRPSSSRPVTKGRRINSSIRVSNARKRPQSTGTRKAGSPSSASCSKRDCFAS